MECGLAAYKEVTLLTDLDLINLSKKGDRLAFNEIVKRHKGKVAATIYGMLGRCDEADDIGQEVFIRFFNSIENFRGDSLLSTYLIRIAMNLSLNELHKRKIKKVLSLDILIESGFQIKSETNSAFNGENSEIINNAMNKLSAKYRSVLVLRLIDGHSSEETAEILNLPLGTVLSRLSRAQIKLKELLQPYKLMP